MGLRGGWIGLLSRRTDFIRCGRVRRQSSIEKIEEVKNEQSNRRPWYRACRFPGTKLSGFIDMCRAESCLPFKMDCRRKASSIRHRFLTSETMPRRPLDIAVESGFHSLVEFC